jgi:hypothetical protein
VKNSPPASLHLSLLLALAVPAKAWASWLVLIDQQGTTPNRVITYADAFVHDESPLPVLSNLAALKELESIKRVKLTMVYEALDRPFWMQARMDIRCPSVALERRSRRAASDDGNQPTRMPEAVLFRMHDGRTRAKNSPQITPLTSAAWQSSANDTMRRAYQVACNAPLVTAAINASFDANNVLIPAVYRERMTPLGLGETLVVPSSLLQTELAELTWSQMWPDVQMPPISHGPPLTEQERLALQQRVEQAQRDLEVQKAAVLASLEEQQAEFDFRDEAARLRGGRRTSKTEADMLMAWQGKSERDVVVAMGAPQVNEAAGIRFLAYGQDYDSRYVVQRVYTGHSWVEGVYRSCNIQFVLIPDRQREFRVADVVVTAFKSGDGWSPNLCDEMTEAPRS